MKRIITCRINGFTTINAWDMIEHLAQDIDGERITEENCEKKILNLENKNLGGLS